MGWENLKEAANVNNLIFIIFIALVGEFVNRAHMEVLKNENLEDQILSKKLVDIICFSPRNIRKKMFNFNLNEKDNKKNTLS